MLLRLIAPVLFAAIASANASSHPFVSGEPMKFPPQSTGVVDDLVRLYSVNCKAEEHAVQMQCIELLQKRGAECEPRPSATFQTQAYYKAWAVEFSRCLFPRPICRGVEVTSLEECSDNGGDP